MNDQEKIVVQTRKLTDHKWINLYNGTCINTKGNTVNWIYASRKTEQAPWAKRQPDAVVIIPIVAFESSLKLCVIKEYRIPLMDYEWGFPAGLIEQGEPVQTTIERELKEETGLNLEKIHSISSPVYSSSGMTDESVRIAIVNASGTIANDNTEESEDIEVYLMDRPETYNLLLYGNKIGAKSYPYLQAAVAFGIDNLRNL